MFKHFHKLRDSSPDDAGGTDEKNDSPVDPEIPANSETLGQDDESGKRANIVPEIPTTSGSVEDLAARHIGFDPEIHAVNSDGTPRLKADGTYALKRGSKAGKRARAALPPKNAASAEDAGAAVKPSENTEEAARKIRLEASAAMSANMVFNLGVMVFGDPLGKPKDKGEADGMKLAFQNYYTIRGVPDIPPELGLFIVVAAYAGPRLRHESMRDKVKSWAGGLKKLLGK